MPREGPKLPDLMQGLRAAQKGLALAQQDLEETEVTGSAGGGLVTVVMRGTGEVTSVKFEQAAVDEGDPESLATLTVTALRNATDALKSVTANRLTAVTGDLESSLIGRERRDY